MTSAQTNPPAALDNPFGNLVAGSRNRGPADAPAGAGWCPGSPRRHVPDLLVLTDGSIRLVDVKPQDRHGDPKVVTQFAWTRRLCDVKGWGFKVWSEPTPT